MKPAEGYMSVGFSQQVIGRLDGMNEKGLVVGLHFVNNQHRGKGFLATTIVRMVLEECTCIEEAIDFIKNIPHRYCYNYSLTDRSGDAVIVQVSPEMQNAYYTKPLICTNHFETYELKMKNREHIQGSIKRKEYLLDLLHEQLSKETVYCHFNDGNSPLFSKNYNEFFGTLHTVIYSPKDLSVIVGIGENSKPTKLSLQEFIDGGSLPNSIKGIINRSHF